MKVKSIGSNQTEVQGSDGLRILVSYETPVAAWLPGVGYVRTIARHSQTTSKHINKWIGSEEAKSVPQDYLERRM